MTREWLDPVPAHEHKEVLDECDRLRAENESLRNALRARGVSFSTEEFLEALEGNSDGQ